MNGLKFKWILFKKRLQNKTKSKYKKEIESYERQISLIQYSLAIKQSGYARRIAYLMFLRKEMENDNYTAWEEYEGYGRRWVINAE